MAGHVRLKNDFMENEKCHNELAQFVFMAEFVMVQTHELLPQKS